MNTPSFDFCTNPQLAFNTKEHVFSPIDGKALMHAVTEDMAGWFLWHWSEERDMQWAFEIRSGHGQQGFANGIMGLFDANVTCD